MSYVLQSRGEGEPAEMRVSGTALGLLCELLGSGLAGRPGAVVAGKLASMAVITPEECRLLAGSLQAVPEETVTGAIQEIARALSQELGGDFDHMLEPKAVAKSRKFLERFAEFAHKCAEGDGFSLVS